LSGRQFRIEAVMFDEFRKAVLDKIPGGGYGLNFESLLIPNTVFLEALRLHFWFPE